ncbi:MAG: sugar transferase [Paracoccaceae bacterium]
MEPEVLKVASLLQFLPSSCKVDSKMFDAFISDAKRTQKRWVYKNILKNIFDFVIASSALIPLLPVLLITALAIRLTSSDPIIHKCVRSKKNGVPFTMYKFRSMHISKNASQITSTTRPDDPRVTSVGRFIRKYHIDELPQLYNVLKFDMSLVGPRPEQVPLCKKYQIAIPDYSKRLSVKPGITGWAQINNGYARNIQDTEKKLQFDLFYINNLSFFFDLKIIFQTFWYLLAGQKKLKGKKVK